MFILIQVVSYTWLLCFCTLLLIFTHYMYLYNLILMILASLLVFLIFIHVFVFNFMYMLILSKTIDIHVYPIVTCFICHVFYYGLFWCLDMYVYFSFDKTYIYLEVCLVLIKIKVLMILCFWVRNFDWASLSYLHEYVDYMIFIHSISFVYSWFWIHENICAS